MIKGIKMRKKDFIYFASAAVLLAASVQVAHADEVGEKESAVTESEAVTTQASSVPVVEEKQEVGTHQYAAPAPVTELPVTSSGVTKADDPQVETKPISAGESAPSSESAAKPVTGTTSFYSAGSKAPSGRTVSTLSRPQGDLSIENNNEVTGTFDAVVRNVVSPTGLKEVLVPSWSVADGQDDLIWHKAVRQADGSYRATIKASDHKNSVGQYQVHVHYLDQENRRRYVTETIVEVRQSRPSGTLSIENNNSSTGSLDAVVRDIVAPNGIKEILVPSWSLENGQDDLIWHKATRQADGSYRVTIKATDHKNSTGEYRADAYLIDESNNRFYLTEKVVEVRQSRPSGTLSIKHNQDSTTFDAVIRNVIAPNGLKEVLIPTWSDKNGQDDLIWHKASKQTDGSYRATIKVSDHKNDDGKYNIHVYYVDQNNQRSYITETTTEVRPLKPSGTITIENNNTVTGTFDAVIRNVVAPKGLKEVLVPTWSDPNGPDDLVWHKAVLQSDGSYRATIKASDHKNEDGKYNVHVYYVDNDNQRNYITETTVEVRQARRSGTIVIQNNNKDTGTFDVIIKDVYSPKGVRTVQVPTWSDKDGQDDIRWYEATRQANGDYKVSVKASDHKNSTGKYHVHLYYIQNDGSRVGAGTTTTEVEFRNLTTKT